MSYTQDTTKLTKKGRHFNQPIIPQEKMVLSHNMNSPTNLIFVLATDQVNLRLWRYAFLVFKDSHFLVLFQNYFQGRKSYIPTDNFK